MLDDLPRISCPVLVLGDSTDAVLGPETSYEICEKLKERQAGKDRKGDGSAEVPVCECYMYDGFGHAAFDTAPDYRKRILGFFLGPHFQE